MTEKLRLAAQYLAAGPSFLGSPVRFGFYERTSGVDYRWLNVSLFPGARGVFVENLIGKGRERRISFSSMGGSNYLTREEYCELKENAMALLRAADKSLSRKPKT